MERFILWLWKNRRVERVTFWIAVVGLLCIAAYVSLHLLGVDLVSDG